jgi:D-lyxose ketol-isomerase
MGASFYELTVSARKDAHLVLEESMISRKDYDEAKARAARMMREAGVVITDAEVEAMDVADFGLSDFHCEGAAILTFFNTERVAARVLALFPLQTEPEHWHEAVGPDKGKEETCRIVSGACYFYVPGEDTLSRGFVPKGKDACYTMRHEIVLGPGDQITLVPGTKHWFQAGPEGTVMFSFSSAARDAADLFTDPDIVRATVVKD